uniref:Histidine kinase n=1 Tax=Globodera pallida TaxID=36090 RepID=A0A183C9W3_GLOPA
MNGICLGEGNLPLRRRVLVAIDGGGQSEYLVRVGRRIAERRDAPWTVVTVQRRREDDSTRREIDAAFALARRLGGEAELLHGPSIADALLDHAAHNSVSTLVLGRTRERPFARMLNRTLTQQLIQRGAHFEITIIGTPQARARARRHGLSMPTLSTGRDTVLALVATALACLVAAGGRALVGARTSAAVMAAALCFLAYNFFFIAPRFTFAISARQGVITVFLFLVAALVAGRLASRLRMQVVALRAANRHANARQVLGGQLTRAASNEEVAQAGREALEQALDAPAWLRIGADTSTSGSAAPGDTDLAAADWAHRHGQPSGRFTDTLAGAEWWFLPLLDGDERSIGVAGMRFPRSAPRLTPEQRQLAEAMVDDIAQAALRTRLVADLEKAHVSNETERLRSALLSSVSHDLRSPLAAMIGSADSLSNYAEAMDASDRRALLDTILGTEGLQINRDWIGVDELVGSAARRLQRYQPDVRLQLDIPSTLGPIWVHPALVEQAVFNVMENAAKFSPPGAAVEVQARLVDSELRIDVLDAGPGIPDDERARIFDMFYSVERGERTVTIVSLFGQAVSLGLTIMVPHGSTSNLLLSLAAKVFNGVSWASGPLLLSEMSPTTVRNMMYGIVATVGEIGSVFAPYLDRIGDENVQKVAVTVMSALAILFALVAPETSGRALPQDLADFDAGPFVALVGRVWKRWRNGGQQQQKTETEAEEDSERGALKGADETETAQQQNDEEELVVGEQPKLDR